MDTPVKTCTKCKRELPADAEHFHADKQKQDGLRSECIDCRRETRRNTYEVNPEKMREISREFYHANLEKVRESLRKRYHANPEKAREASRKYRNTNIEKVRERDREYYEVNPQKVRERNRKYYEANAEKRREARRKWAKANPEKNRAQASKWAKANPEKIKERKRQYVLSHPEKMSEYRRNRRARKRAASGKHTAADIIAQLKRQKRKCYYCHCKLTDQYHVDHVIPLARGGSNGPENLVIACPTCNCSKNDKLPHEWSGSNGRLL